MKNSSFIEFFALYYGHCSNTFVVSIQFNNLRARVHTLQYYTRFEFTKASHPPACLITYYCYLRSTLSKFNMKSYIVAVLKNID